MDDIASWLARAKVMDLRSRLPLVLVLLLVFVGSGFAAVHAVMTGETEHGSIASAVGHVSIESKGPVKSLPPMRKWDGGAHAHVETFHLHRLVIKMAPWIGGQHGDFAIGFGSRGRLLMDNSPCDCDVITRYDLRTHRYLKARAETSYAGDVTVSDKNQVWSVTGHMGTSWLVRSVFTRRARYQRYITPIHWRGNAKYGGDYTALALDGSGNAWASGWSSGYPGMPDRRHPPRVPGLPGLVPPGKAALLFVPYNARYSYIHIAPAPAPLTGVAVAGNGSVWAIDPYHVCVHWRPGKRCLPPRILRYNSTTGTFTYWLMPKSVWPDFIPESYGGFTPLAIAPDGSVWSAVHLGRNYDGTGGHPRGTELIHFRNGHFSAFHIGLGDVESTPLFDKRGNVWLMGANTDVTVLNPSNGHHFRLRQRGGSLIQDRRGHMWYVWTPGSWDRALY